MGREAPLVRIKEIKAGTVPGNPPNVTKNIAIFGRGGTVVKPVPPPMPPKAEAIPAVEQPEEQPKAKKGRAK
jgi:hypothetical protein